MRSAVPLTVLCLGCVGHQSRPTTGVTPVPEAVAPPDLDAMLLPPVAGQLALWVNQPANFAIVGVAPQGGAYVLYQQTALDAVPASGYIYVPRNGSEPDVGYDQIYLVASTDTLNLATRSLDDMTARAGVIDAYDVEIAHRDTLPCWDPLDPRLRVTDHPVVIPPGAPACRRLERSYQVVAGHRGFFVVYPTRPAPKPGVLHRKPGIRLDTGDERALRTLAARDQWHAITHAGEPGTELVRALGYVRVDDHWVLGRANPVLAIAHGEVRDILNGAIGTLRGPASALVMESTGRVSEVITSTWATASVDHWMAPGNRGVTAIEAIESRGERGGESSRGASYGYETGRSSARYESSRYESRPSSASVSSYHEAPASHSGYSAPSAPAPSGGGSSGGGGHRP
jgi:hypothetical protein